MARSRLIVTTDLAGLSPVLAEGVAVSTRYERLRDSVEAKVPGGAALLTEPVLGAATPTGYKSATWYAAGEGESLPLGEVSAQERADAIAHLGRSLDAIVDLVGDVPFGPWLRAAFLVPNAESIRVIDGKAILVNWGFVPANLPQTEAALEKHFVDTIGKLIGWSGLPRLNAAGEVEVPRLAPPVRAAEELPPVAAPPAAAAEIAAPVPPPSAAAPPPVRPAVVPAPAPSQGRLVGAGIALFLLGVLVGLLLLTLRPWNWWQGSSSLGARAVTDAVTQGLTEERDRLRTLLGGDVCTLPPDRLPGRILEQPPKPARPGQLGEMSPPVMHPPVTPTPVTPSIEAAPKLVDPPAEPPPIVREQGAVDPPPAVAAPKPPPPCDTVEVPAQVMLAMDTSGSMALPAGNRPDILEMERLAEAGNVEKRRQMQALMNQPGRKRMDDARAAANELISSLSRKAAVGIASFDGRCDARIEVAPTLDRSQAKRVIEQFKPQGPTPIAATLRRVRDAFGADGDPDTPRSVILITDGGENCKGDPCGEARQLAQSYKNLKIHVIDVTGTSQLQCLADATKGTIVKAGDLAELKAAVARAATGVHQQMNCTPPGGLPGGSPSGPPAATPGTPQRRGEAPSLPSPAQPGAARQPDTKLSLNEQLERSTVLVIAAQAGSLGSGFFVAPDLLVTSRHVVQGKGGVSREVLVTSRALGQPLRGEVVALSDGNAIGGRDYAIVRLRDAPVRQPVVLPIATAVEKRVSVIAAGYPGYLVQNDPAMKRLAAGDFSSAPELVLSEGKVQVMHKSPAGIPLVVHSADISQGNSGGPLVDSCGRVVAINTFIGLDPQSGRRGLYSLGGDDLVDFLKSKGVAARSVGSTCDPD